MEGLSEALKAVERELNFARKAYRAVLFLYWAVAFPGIYLTSIILSLYTSVSRDSAYVLLSAGAILLFGIENSKAFRKVVQLEKVLEKREKVDLKYILAQIIIWSLAVITAGLSTGDTALSAMLGIGSGMLALTIVEYAFKHSFDRGMLLAGVVSLLLTIPYGKPPLSGLGYSTVVLSASFALAAYINLRSAMRE